MCVFFALEHRFQFCSLELFNRWDTVAPAEGGYPMIRKILVVTVAFISVLSVAGCAGQAGIGKGKAPPPPVVTKG
jgi:hypothetical protein